MFFVGSIILLQTVHRLDQFGHVQLAMEMHQDQLFEGGRERSGGLGRRFHLHFYLLLGFFCFSLVRFGGHQLFSTAAVFLSKVQWFRLGLFISFSVFCSIIFYVYHTFRFNKFISTDNINTSSDGVCSNRRGWRSFTGTLNPIAMLCFITSQVCCLIGPFVHHIIVGFGSG
uniref:Uncharacterized protein n=1 Tax=Cacopsylla melanoneura TaxID=428564 RepID=A0A8D8Q855_9HEMI